jgi:hypothetical protein
MKREREMYLAAKRREGFKNNALPSFRRYTMRFRRTVKLFMKMNNGHFPRKKAKIRFDHDFEKYNPQF